MSDARATFSWRAHTHTYTFCGWSRRNDCSGDEVADVRDVGRNDKKT